jgi:Xaa-Pro aminopeptidase
MSGKKVFTHAGELLANFFSTKRKIDIKANKQEEILNYIGKTENLTGIEVDIREFKKQYELTKTQALTEIDNSIHKKFFNYKITDGVKEIPVNEMVQRLYHELKNLDATIINFR